MRNLFINLDNQLVDGSGEMVRASDYRGANNLIVWIPSERVTMLEANTPTRNHSELEQSIPYALEDELLGDIAELHFAWNVTPRNTPIPTAVVSKQCMQEWIELLQPLRLVGYSLVPDIFCLPQKQPGELSVWQQANRAIVRSGAFAGFAGSIDTIDSYIKANKLKPVGYHLDGIKGAARRVPQSVACSDLPVAYLGDSRGYINLLQGDYQSGAAFLRIVRKNTAVLISLAVVTTLLLGHQLTGYLLLRKEAAQIEQQLEVQAQEIVQDYQQGKPLRVLVERSVQNLQSKLDKQQTQFFVTLEQMIPLLSSCSNCVYESLSLGEDGIQISASSYTSLQNLEAQLKNLSGTEYVVTTQLDINRRNNDQYYTLQFEFSAANE